MDPVELYLSEESNIDVEILPIEAGGKSHHFEYHLVGAA